MGTSVRRIHVAFRIFGIGRSWMIATTTAKGDILMAVKSRIVVTLVVLATSTSLGVQAQGLSPGPPLVVVDSNGAEVGHLLEGWLAVVMINDLAVSIAVERERLTSWAGVELYFTQPDCTGDPFLWLEDIARGPLPYGVMGPTGMLFVADPLSSTSQITSLSKYNYQHQTCYNETNSIAHALVASPSVNLETMFTPPFSVRPTSSVVQAGVPMPELNLRSALLFVLILCCIGFIRLRSSN